MSYVPQNRWANLREPVANTQRPVANQREPVANQREPLANLKEPVANQRPLENTSLPARLAPKLAPTTLASATKAYPYASHKKVQAAPTLDDFPSLNASKMQTAPEALKALKPTAPEALNASKQTALEKALSPPERPNFASLSRDWAKKQKEDEIAQKEKAAAEAITQRFLQEAREKELAENQLLRRIRVGMTHIPSQRKPDSDDEKYKEDEFVEEEDSFSDTPDEEYEEEEEEEDDDGWNGRKHRDELY